MSERQVHTTLNRSEILTADNEINLVIKPHSGGIRLSLVFTRDAPAHVTVPVDTRALLGAIDAVDPDAMRDYLRDTPHLEEK